MVRVQHLDYVVFLNSRKQELQILPMEDPCGIKVTQDCGLRITLKKRLTKKRVIHKLMQSKD